MDTTWLPKDERHLLAGYYRILGDVEKEESFREGTLARLLRGEKTVPDWEHDRDSPERDDEKLKAAVRQWIQGEKQVEAANGRLASRAYIKLTRHESERNVVVVSLTLDGYDLGCRYSSWFSLSQLCFREYKDHWLWLAAACVGGALISQAVDLFRHVADRLLAP